MASQPGHARIQLVAGGLVAVGQDECVRHPAMLPRVLRSSRPDARLRPVPDAPVPPAIQRVLDAAARKGVTIEVTTFDESTHTAAEAAAAVGVDVGQIVKSLVFVIPTTDGLEPVLCLVAGHNRVDVARLAAVTGSAEIRRASAREAHDLTGFSIGGSRRSVTRDRYG